MMPRDQLYGTLNPTIGHLIEKFPSNSSKKIGEDNLYHHNPTKGRLTIYISFVEAFWPFTWRAWCRKSSVRAPLCLSHSHPRLVMLKINRLAKSYRKLLGNCTLATSERHSSHSASSCNKPTCKVSSFKSGVHNCGRRVGPMGSSEVLKACGPYNVGKQNSQIITLAL